MALQIKFPWRRNIFFFIPLVWKNIFLCSACFQTNATAPAFFLTIKIRFCTYFWKTFLDYSWQYFVDVFIQICFTFVENYHFLYKVAISKHWFSGTCSIHTLAVIAYDRYNIIVKGMRATKITWQKSMVVNVTIWASCLAWCVPPYFGWGSYKLGMYYVLRIRN